MTKKNLHTNFSNAVEFANEYTDALPPDLMLKLYAYFKIATDNSDNPNGKTPLINAFKVNALIQAKDMSKEEAMKAYIAIVQKELKS
ncbi:acyl-CoA-binding protein [Aurantibacter crassamenti]|uniref:acyl-CoA-binding protein n=1 Tax=Aurantibacter crassamenti TaxID=1837375 RepID=UPI001939BCF2|nr:acyl-CoA-binding protein [Aurantibacter crassamenti]MBM1108022.1 acyl-CoA-binding protein [Aurantibacter crassamenti]